MIIRFLSFSGNITIILGSSGLNTKIELKGTVTSLNYVLTNVLYVPPSHWNSQYAGMIGKMFQLSIDYDNHFFKFYFQFYFTFILLLFYLFVLFCFVFVLFLSIFSFYPFIFIFFFYFVFVFYTSVFFVCCLAFLIYLSLFWSFR